MKDQKFSEFPPRIVTVYGYNWCPDTVRAIETLQSLRVQPRFIDIERTLEHLTNLALISEAEGARRLPLVEVNGSLFLHPSEVTLRELLTPMMAPTPDVTKRA